MPTIQLTLPMPLLDETYEQVNKLSGGKAAEVFDEILSSSAFKMGVFGFIDGLIEDWILRNQKLPKIVKTKKR